MRLDDELIEYYPASPICIVRFVVFWFRRDAGLRLLNGGISRHRRFALIGSSCFGSDAMPGYVGLWVKGLAPIYTNHPQAQIF